MYFFPSGSSSGGIGSGGLTSFFVGLVDQTCCLVWTMCPFMVSLLDGQYFEAFWYVSPGHDVKLPGVSDQEARCCMKVSDEGLYDW